MEALRFRSILIFIGMIVLFAVFAWIAIPENMPLVDSLWLVFGFLVGLIGGGSLLRATYDPITMTPLTPTTPEEEAVWRQWGLRISVILVPLLSFLFPPYQLHIIMSSAMCSVIGLMVAAITLLYVHRNQVSDS